MNNNKKCSVGISLNEDCNALTFCCLTGKTLESLSDSDKQLLFLRTNCTFTDEDSICYQHEKFYHILKIYNDIAAILENSTVNKLKSIYESLISKLLKNLI